MATNAAAQPLCLGDTIWNEPQQQCVPIDDEDASVAPDPASASPQPSLDVTVSPTAPDDTAGAVPSASDTAIVPVANERDSQRLTFVHTFIHTCAPDRDWYALADAGPAYLVCPDPPTGEMPFLISVDGFPVANPVGSLGSAGGSIYAPDIAPGDITIQEQIPAGFGVPIVYCKLFTVEEVVARPLVRYLVTDDGAITIPAVLNGEGIYCEWSNVPLAISPAVSITAYQCPPGFDPTGVEPPEMRAQCPAVADRAFTLSALDRVTSDSTTRYGVVAFDQLRPGSVTLAGDQPSNFAAPYVFCQVNGPEGQTLRAYDYQFPSGPDSITYQLDTFETLRCDWFFVPGGSGSNSVFTGCDETGTPDASTDGVGTTVGPAIVCRTHQESGD